MNSLKYRENYWIQAKFNKLYCTSIDNCKVWKPNYAKTNILKKSTIFSILGQPDASSSGPECLTDFVIIPGGVDDQGRSADRYCGLGFPGSVTCKYF